MVLGWRGSPLAGHWVAENIVYRQRVLIVSSFVRPRIGGVEQFAGWLEDRLNETCDVRVLSCAIPNMTSDVTVPCRLVSSSGWPLVLPTPSTLRTLSAEIRRADCVLIQNFAHPLCLWAAVVARWRKVRAFTIVHTAQPPSYGSAAYRAIAGLYDATASRWTFRCAPPVAFSDSVVQFVRGRFGLVARRVPYPLRSLPERQATPTGATFRVVYAGRLAPEKAPDVAVEVCERLRDRHDVELHVYGDGPMATELAALATNRPWLVLHGPRPWADTVRAQASAHVSLSTSRQDSLQISLLESLAMGVPCVATRIGDAPQYYDADLDQFLCDPDDIPGLTVALDELLSGYDAWNASFARHAELLRDRFDETVALRAFEELVR